MTLSSFNDLLEKKYYNNNYNLTYIVINNLPVITTTGFDFESLEFIFLLLRTFKTISHTHNSSVLCTHPMYRMKIEFPRANFVCIKSSDTDRQKQIARQEQKINKQKSRTE